jgi:GT2 family glycosyltransferase
MDLSVVIVNWNTKKLVLECIASIIEQTERHSVEIIVVDNGSSDSSPEAIEAQFPACKVIRNADNRGFAAANNVGIAAAAGRNVCLMNSDVKVLDRALDVMCLYMAEHPRVGVLGPQILTSNLEIQNSCSELPSVWSTLTQALFLDRLFPRTALFRNRFMMSFDYSSEANVPVLSGCFLMVRREALEQVGLLDERFFIYKEDVDWCKRFGDAGWRVVFCPSARAIHYGGASSASAPVRFMIEMEKANRQYWRKHHGWLARQAAAMIGVLHYALRLALWSLKYVMNGGGRSAKEMIAKYAACLYFLGRGRERWSER